MSQCSSSVLCPVVPLVDLILFGYIGSQLVITTSVVPFCTSGHNYFSGTVLHIFIFIRVYLYSNGFG